MNSLLEQESFRLILDALHDGVAIYDREGILLWVNEKVRTERALTERI